MNGHLRTNAGDTTTGFVALNTNRGEGALVADRGKGKGKGDGKGIAILLDCY